MFWTSRSRPKKARAPQHWISVASVDRILYVEQTKLTAEPTFLVGCQHLQYKNTNIFFFYRQCVWYLRFLDEWAILCATYILPVLIYAEGLLVVGVKPRGHTSQASVKLPSTIDMTGPGRRGEGGSNIFIIFLWAGQGFSLPLTVPHLVRETFLSRL